MGAFNGVIGTMKVKEDSLQQAKQDLLRLMSAGGMVQVEAVKMYGKEIYLLKNLEFDKDGDCEFHYNYITDEHWESAYISNNLLSSGKVGIFRFSDVMYAGYTLCSIYSDWNCVPHANGGFFDPHKTISWINQVLKRKYTNQGITDLWQFYQNMHKEEDDEYKDIEDVIRYCLSLDCNEEQIATCLYVQNGWKKLTDKPIAEFDESASLDKLSFVELIHALRSTLQVFKDKNGNLELVLEALTKAREEKLALLASNTSTALQQSLTSFMLYLNPVVYLKAISEIYAKDFWSLWAKVGEHLQDWGKLYVKNVTKEQEPEFMTTEEFMAYSMNQYIFNYNNAVKGAPERQISADDLLYYFAKVDGINFSKSLMAWFTELRDRHQKLCEEQPQKIYAVDSFVQSLICILENADNTYHRVMAFQHMFYEFLTNATDIRYQAAIKLLEELINENRDIAARYEPHFHTSWDFIYPSVVLNEGRMCIKRYLALLANKELREKVLKF